MGVTGQQAPLASLAPIGPGPRQDQVIAALRFKCDCLWAQLDALYSAYVAPGHVPHGVFGAPPNMVLAS